MSNTVIVIRGGEGGFGSKVTSYGSIEEGLFSFKEGFGFSVS